jgi:hypothetical protein
MFILTVYSICLCLSLTRKAVSGSVFTVTNDTNFVKVGIHFRNTVPMVTRIVKRLISTHTPNSVSQGWLLKI